MLDLQLVLRLSPLKSCHLRNDEIDACVVLCSRYEVVLDMEIGLKRRVLMLGLGLELTLASCWWCLTFDSGASGIDFEMRQLLALLECC